MKISYKWLKEFVDFDLTPAELCDTLLFLGLETKIISSVGNWTGVITAKVVNKQKHPQADKLSLCTVDTGTNTYAIVCGAANVEAGQIIALAAIGAELPGNFIIKNAKIRGVESQGMICSESELGLAAQSAGIMVLPESTPLGKPLESVLGDGDTILEVEITTNRGDCLSHWGIAREIAAKLATQVRLPDIDTILFDDTFPVTINNPELCSRYIGCVIEGVTVKASPDWIVKRLESCGIRSINNIVDITNYVLLELGHPLHAFDIENLEGKQIIVRRAVEDESITALDGKKYTLDDSMLVIADNVKPQAIAGVMGGEHSGVVATTTTVVVESALFDPISIRKTSRTLGLSTDASYRFERGSSWDVAELAASRAAQLILHHAGGILQARTDRVANAYTPLTIELRTSAVEKVLGLSVSPLEIKTILTNLGMGVTELVGGFSVTIASWRRDIAQEVDLIEEIARIKGYEHIGQTVMPIIADLAENKSRPPVLPDIYTRLSSLGFCEALNYSFVEEKELTQFGFTSSHRLANPLSKEYELLRPSLLPGLWKNLTLNLGQGYTDIRLYESGTVFIAAGEKKRFGIIMTGAVWGSWWKWYGKEVTQTADFNFFSGILSHVLSNRKYYIAPNKNCSPFFHPGKTARLEVAGKTAGEFGVMRPDYCQELGCGDIVYGEFDCDIIELPAGDKVKHHVALKRFPPVNIDLSLIADTSVSVDSIFKSISRSSGQDIAIDTRLIDVYTDTEKIGAGKISYTVGLSLRHSERTLTDQDTQKITAELLANLEKKLAVSLRK
ncbi:MAG: phenylalanine--tRNA ligase subunit beta [Endomicrobiales bacterium]|jgi:phenylalanyl-tRNA synthetase beta chain